MQSVDWLQEILKIENEGEIAILAVVLGAIVAGIGYEISVKKPRWATP